MKVQYFQVIGYVGDKEVCREHVAEINEAEKAYNAFDEFVKSFVYDVVKLVKFSCKYRGEEEYDDKEILLRAWYK